MTSTIVALLSLALQATPQAAPPLPHAPQDCVKSAREFTSRRMKELGQPTTGNVRMLNEERLAMLRECADVLAHVHIADTFNHKASSGLRYIVNPPGSTARVHQHLDIGQGEVDWDVLFRTLAEIGFDGIATVCVFAWEERAEDSARVNLAEVSRYLAKHR